MLKIENAYNELNPHFIHNLMKIQILEYTRQETINIHQNPLISVNCPTKFKSKKSNHSNNALAIENNQKTMAKKYEANSQQISEES